MSDDDTPGRELATVTHLPARQVLDGEIVTEEQWAELTSQRGRALARRDAYRRDVATVTRVTRTVVTHPRTRTIAGHIIYVGIGLVVVTKRWWEAKTTSAANRMIRTAMATGNLEATGEWWDRRERAKKERHARVMGWLRAPLDWFIAAAWTCGGGLALLLALGVTLAVTSKDVHQVFAPIKAAFWVVAGVVTFVTVAWTFLLCGAAVIVTGALWWVGRNSGSGPSWLATSAERDTDVTIDETTIARALAALRIPQVTQYLKEGAPLQYLTPCRADGRGTHAVIRLPAGVTAEKIARRRADLATGLHRLAKEVWPTTGAEAGILDLWIADKGALAEGAGPYPLLTDGACDVFKGVPFGKQLRGTPIVAPVMERNTLTGGMPGQGKSSAARVIMAGAALDPTAELRIWVPDANFDFEAFRPRCSRYVMGAEDERIAEILADLRELHAEVQSRGELLVRYETPAVTREMANKGIGLHPLFGLLEEAHVAIGHPTYGQEIAKLLVDIVRLGRKRGIHLIVSTQAPTKDSLPRDVTRNCSNGIAFAVGDHVANDALLGQGAYSAGHRATELIPGADRGTAVVKGFTGERSEIVQVYFTSVDREDPAGDQITPIIDRSLDLIRRRGKGMPGARLLRAQLAVERDLLTDVADCLDGEEVVRATDMAARLRRLAPQHPQYQHLDGRELAEQLRRQYGVEVRKAKGYDVIRASRVFDAINRRDEEGG